MLRAAFVLLLFVVGFTNGVQVLTAWTNWSKCPVADNCTARSLQCSISGVTLEPVTCRHGNTSVEEQLHNCTSCNGSWTDPKVLQACMPTCFNSSSWLEETCSEDSFCIRRSRIPCNEMSLCTGKWIESNSSCNATCSQSGVITEIAKCYKNNILSYECKGTYGIFQARSIHKICPALSWSSWVSGSCTKTCGGGHKSSTRSCGQAVQTKEINCNTEECPSWGSWVQVSGCMHNIGARSRSCMYNGTLHGNCTGAGPVEVVLHHCNMSTINHTVTSCSDTSQIPLVAGLLLLFGLFLVAMVLLYKMYKLKKRYPSATNGSTDFMYQCSSQTLATSTDENMKDKQLPKSELPVVRIVPYRVPLKDPDDDGHSPTVPRKERCKSMDDRLFSHLRVPEIVEEETDFVDDEIQLEQGDSIPDDMQEPCTKQEWLSLRPSLRQAYKDKFVKQDMSWQRTQTLKPMKSSMQESCGIKGHRRTHSEGGVLDGDDNSPTPLKPVRKNSVLKSGERSGSLSHSPKPPKPVRNKEMRSGSFNASTWYMDRDPVEDVESGNLFVFGGISPSKSAPQLDQWMGQASSLGSLDEVVGECPDVQNGCEQPLEKEKPL